MVNSMIGIDVFNKANKKQFEPVILYAHPIKPIIAISDGMITMNTIITALKLLRFTSNMISIIMRPALISSFTSSRIS